MSAADSVPAVEYRPVDGFPGYRVGDDGSVWSCLTRTGGFGEWKKLKGWQDRFGYLHFTLTIPGVRQKSRPGHRLVLEAFRGPCPVGMEACHSPDRAPSNNALANLRWDTHASNHADKTLHGTAQIGENHGMHKITEADVTAIDAALVAGMSHDQIAADFGICLQLVAAIAGRRLWPHVPRLYDAREVVRGQCVFCGSEFAVTRAFRNHKRYCSEKCSGKARWKRDSARKAV